MRFISTWREKKEKITEKEEEDKDEEEEEEGEYLCHNKTAIVDKKPSPFSQFTEWKTLETSSLLCPVRVPESRSPLLKCLSEVPSFLLFIPSPHDRKITTVVTFSFLPLLLPC